MTPERIASAKKALRQKARDFRKALGQKERMDASERMAKRLVALEAYREARVVFAYASMPEEVYLDGLLRRVIADDKTLVIPLVTGRGTMEAVRLERMEDLTADAYGIRSVHGPAIAPETIDLIVVPGAAFDEAGHRLGLGAGFYDRFMRRCANALRVALTFEGLVVESVPVADYDENVDLILTEKRAITCPSRQ